MKDHETVSNEYEEIKHVADKFGLRPSEVYQLKEAFDDKFPDQPLRRDVFYQCITEYINLKKADEAANGHTENEL